MKKPLYYRIFDYRKQLLPNAYLASLEEDVVNIDEAMQKTGYSIGYPGWGFIYHMLLSHLHPEKHNVIVETGTNQGASTIVLAQALADSKRAGHVYTIELDDNNYAKALHNFAQAGVAQHITAIKGDSREELKKIVAEVDEFSAVVLDASHLYDDVLSEFEIIYPKLGPHSIVVFDNTYLLAEEHEDQRVNGALKYIQKTYGGNLIDFKFVSWYTPGLAIWQKQPF